MNHAPSSRRKENEMSSTGSADGRIAIYGSGGFGREVLEILVALRETGRTWDFVGFLNDDPATHGTMVHGFPVLGGGEWLSTHPDVAVVLGIGSPATKRRLTRRMQELGLKNLQPTLVHPRAWIGSNVIIGKGSVICAGACVTTDVKIGDHVILNLGCTVGHDSLIGDYSTLNPATNISGNVVVKEGVEIGTNVCVIPGAEVGSWSVIGAGSVVVKAIPPNTTCVGSPARAIKERPDGWQIWPKNTAAHVGLRRFK